MSVSLRLAGPLMVAQVSYMAMGFFDTVMVGNVGPLELAAVAIGTSLWHPLYLLILGVLMATSTSIAHLCGAGRWSDMGGLVRQALWLSILLSLPAVLLLRDAIRLLQWLSVDPPIVPVTQDYLDALSWGVPAVFAYIVLRFLSEGLTYTQPIMVIGVVGLLVNIAGNYLLIYGHWGLPALGATGCGLATALSMWVMLICMGVLVVFHKRYRPVALLRRWDWPRWRELRPLLMLGLPIGLSIFAEASIFAAVALVLGFLGATVVAGHQIALNVAAMSFMLPLSLAMALTARIGQALGRGSQETARFIGLTGIALAGLIMAIMATLISTSARLIVALYTDDLQVADIAAHLLLFAALFQISDGFQVAASGSLRGFKDTRIPFCITVLAYWVIGFPVGYFLGIGAAWGAAGMWVGLIAGLSVAAVLLNTRFWFVSKSAIYRYDDINRT
ncbi:MAG: MATE family efflux transporter [Gammaproteobacteria bacterium]|nr:MATE family efflux transporter [Gammaproteobacteria bacterium]MCP5458063.1 MATE family efflux transporter [Gammaproteobacteria bacterium]